MVNTGRPLLTVLVGAGGSIELGVPSTQDLTRIAEDAISSFHVRGPQDFIERPVEPIARTLIEHCQQHYGSQYSFEHLLHVLETAETLLEGRPFGGKPVAEMFLTSGHNPALNLVFDEAFLGLAQKYLIEAIHNAISGASDGARQHPSWADMSKFWERLDEEFDLKVVSLNYDTLVDRALGLGGEAQWFESISDELAWRFKPPIEQLCPRLMHLHGGIHFGYRDFRADSNRFACEDEFDDLYWLPTSKEALNSLNSSRTAMSDYNQAGRKCIKGPLITGLNKPDKLLLEPYRSYFSSFDTLTRQSKRLIVIGYGFGDLHVNAVIRAMTKWHGPRRRIAVVDYVDGEGYFSSAWMPHDRVSNDKIVTIKRWAEAEDFLEDMWLSVNPVASKNELVRFYHKGFLEFARCHLDDLVAFMTGC